jgi:hypothetical protein
MKLSNLTRVLELSAARGLLIDQAEGLENAKIALDVTVESARGGMYGLTRDRMSMGACQASYRSDSMTRAIKPAIAKELQVQLEANTKALEDLGVLVD